MSSSSAYISINDIPIDEDEIEIKNKCGLDCLKNIYKQIKKLGESIYFIIPSRLIALTFLILQIYGTILFEVEYWSIKNYSNDPYSFYSSCENKWFNGTINDIISDYGNVQPAYPTITTLKFIDYIFLTILDILLIKIWYKKNRDIDIHKKNASCIYDNLHRVLLVMALIVMIQIPADLTLHYVSSQYAKNEFKAGSIWFYDCNDGYIPTGLSFNNTSCYYNVFNSNDFIVNCVEVSEISNNGFSTYTRALSLRDNLMKLTLNYLITTTVGIISTTFNFCNHCCK